MAAAPDGPVPAILSLERMNRIRLIDAPGTELVAGAGLVNDGVIAQSEGQRRQFRELRESLPQGEPPDRCDLQPRYLGAAGVSA